MNYKCQLVAKVLCSDNHNQQRFFNVYIFIPIQTFVFDYFNLMQELLTNTVFLNNTCVSYDVVTFLYITGVKL